jgi:hypothetical protein
LCYRTQVDRCYVEGVMLFQVCIDGYGDDGLSVAGAEALGRAGFGMPVPGWKPGLGDPGVVARFRYFRVAIGDADSIEDAIARVRTALGPEADRFCIHAPGSSVPTAVLQLAD